MDEARFLTQVIPLHAQMYRIALCCLKNHFDAEDAVQEAVLKAWTRMDTLRNEDVFIPWLKQILRNQCIEMLRKKSRCFPLELDSFPGETGEWPSFDLELLDGLSAEMRTPLWLHYGCGCKIREIAQRMGVPAGTVSSRMARGIARLRNTYS